MGSFLNPTCKSRVNSTPPCPFTPSSSWQNQGVLDITPQIPTSGIVVAKFSPQDQYQIAQAILTAENSLKCVRAVGSGWSYSDAVIPEAPGSRDTGFIIDSTAFAQPLDSELAQILAPGGNPGSLAFVEAGMTLKALNEWLDGNNPSRALPTMGGSAGQTIGGLISTGSHGGDWDRPPIADSVQAVYLVGAGGLHFWIERPTPVTDRAKLTALFPCLDIRYDQTLFDAVLVSMGAMGVIYAVLLKVVPQYSLLEWNYWGDWDDMSPAARAPNGFQDLASGKFSQMFDWLPQLIPADVLGPNPTSRFLQIVVNPFLNIHGGHTCVLTNRLQLPAGWRQGTPPRQLDPNAISAGLTAAVAGDPRLDFGDAVQADLALIFGIGSGGGNENVVTQLVNEADKYGPFILDDAVTLIMLALFPLPPVDDTQYPRRLLWPYVDTGYKVMTGNGGSATPGGIPWTSTEVFCAFPDALDFIDAILEHFDAATNRGEYPLGYISLRVCGSSAGLLAMEQAELGSSVAAIEVNMVTTPDTPNLVQWVESQVQPNRFLHWGQSCGLLTPQLVKNSYPASAVATWKAVQHRLGGATFANEFMRRCGLIDQPLDLSYMVPILYNT